METVIDEARRRTGSSSAARGAAGTGSRSPPSWELVEPGARGCEVTLRFWTEPSHPLDRLRERLGAERFYRRQWSIALSRLKELIESGRPAGRVGGRRRCRLPA